MKRTLLNSIACFSGITLLALSTSSAPAQILFSTGSPYAQNFDTLANSGSTNTWADNTTLLGWYASKTVGGSTVATYSANYGNSMAGALYSFGAAGANERALGSLASGTPGNFAYGVRFSNDTAQVITNITITYTGEQWRNGGNTATQTLAFSYQVSGSPITGSDAANTTTWTPFPALNFNSPTVGATAGALDGNAAANRQLLANVLLPDVVVLPGQEIFFRWFDLNDAGNDHGLAIDDLTISFTSVAPFTNPPAITGEPHSCTNNAGTTAFFSVTASGTSLTYQWRKDGIDLADGVKNAGCLTPNLMVSNVLAADAGQYTIVVANDGGSVTSAVAVLTVVDPAILTQPQNHTAVAGDNATLSVRAAGSVPLSYQWRCNGADLTDATSSRLSFTPVQTSNQGAYSVVVGNSLGTSITSAVATLTVLTTPGALLAAWDFNATNTLAADAPAASIGSGTAALVATKGAFAGGSPSDPAGAPGTANSGWNTSAYAGQGTSNKLTGVQFNVSTLGYQDLLLTWEERHSDTASKYMRLQYSADGTNFTDGPVLTMTATDNSFVFCSANLAAVAGLNNNSNFAFRIVSEFESTAIGTANDNYAATVTSYRTTGTIRYDLVRVFANPAGTVSPIPLQIQPAGDTVVLIWSNPLFTLASAPNPAGPFIRISSASSPYTNRPTGNSTFFKLVCP